MAEIDKKVIKDRIDKLRGEIREEEIVKNNHFELANRLQVQITAKAGAINELNALINNGNPPDKKLKKILRLPTKKTKKGK